MNKMTQLKFGRSVLLQENLCPAEWLVLLIKYIKCPTDSEIKAWPFIQMPSRRFTYLLHFKYQVNGNFIWSTGIHE